MPSKLAVYANEDDTLLFWSIPAPIKECRGFAIERRITRYGGHEEVADFLQNRTGFENDDISAKPEEELKSMTKPSSEWPFQRFSWTDHDANTGDVVSYRVIPMIRNKDQKLVKADEEASKWSAKITLGEGTSGIFQPFFNRGLSCAIHVPLHC